jgi:hypothetical protein
MEIAHRQSGIAAGDITESGALAFLVEPLYNNGSIARKRMDT